MYRIVGTRGIGKTKMMLEEISKRGGKLICKDPIKMREKAHFYGCPGLDIMSYEDYFSLEDKSNTIIYIANLEEFVTAYTKETLAGYTLSIQ